jgi:predicted ester cyclase
MKEISRRGLAACSAAAALAATGSAEAFGSTRRNEALVRQFWDAFNRQAWDEWDAITTANYLHHPPEQSLTLAEFKDGGAWVHRGLANYRLTIEAVAAEGDRVAIRWSARGRHVGSMFGETPSGREVTAYGMHFHRIERGKLAEDWEVIDFDAFRRQLSPQAG